MDWKDMLSQARDSFPAAEENMDPVRPEKPEQGKKKEKLSVSMEKKGRGGKTATIIYGFTADDREVEAVAAKLKQRLGIGGSSRGGEILLQGDLREKVKPLLREMGYRI